MTRTRRALPKPQTPDTPAPAANEPERPLNVTPDHLIAAQRRSDPISSLDYATRHDVQPNMYPAVERAAAKLDHAMDYYGAYGATNTRDALSFVEATAWPGFQTLALLAQLPEYRTMHETLADETVRTWGRITCSSKDDTSDKIDQLNKAIERLNVRSTIRTAVIHDQAYGGAHIFPRLKEAGDPLPTDTPLLLNPAFFPRNCLDSLANIEPYWVTPNRYNSIDPTKSNFYKPETWRLQSVEVHSSRLWTLVSRPVGDMLKAAYSFRGISLSQLAMPYVDNWLRTRQSVSDTVKQFSITFLKMDLAQALAPGGAYSLEQRAQLFNLMRDNRNLGLIDFTTEEFGQINTPLSGLDALQAQAQEQMAAVSHIPLVKLLGITPAGLNANSDGEIRVWYDYVAGYQAHNLTPLMKWLIVLIQLSEFGEIDPGLSWEWNPLFELNALEEAEMRDKQSITDERYFNMGTVSGEMIAKALELDPTSRYSGILANRDEMDELQDLGEAALAAELTPDPTPPTDPDNDEADQPDQSNDPARRGPPGNSR